MKIYERTVYFLIPQDAFCSNATFLEIYRTRLLQWGGWERF